MGVGLGVLKVVDKVLSNKRVQGALAGYPPGKPLPPTCGQDQRLDVLIEKVDRLCELTEQQNELLAEYLHWRVEQMRPPATMELLPEPIPMAQRLDAVLAQQAAEAAGIDLAETAAFEQRVADDVAAGGALRLRKRR